MHFSLKITQPEQIFHLSNNLEFNKIKVNDVLIRPNEIDASVNNILIQLDRFSNNEFLFEGNIENTPYLVELPAIAGADVAYNPLHPTPWDFCDTNKHRLKWLKFKVTNESGQMLTTAQFGATTEIYMKLYFE
jgi:hypothetical protein